MAVDRSIVVLTGAGISAESGIQTFRAADGLWEQHRIEDVASPAGYARNPELVHHFYNQRRRELLGPGIRPNPAHRALAELEQHWPGAVLVITQNIDNLHERVGSRSVIHMHGELLKVRCVRSGAVSSADQNVGVEDRCTCCAPPSPLRPHVVWFGEMPLEMDRIVQALRACHLFVAIGTSGNVYPAAGFVQEARAARAHTVELNLEPSAVQSNFSERTYGPASQIVPTFVKELLAHGPTGSFP